MRNSKKQTNEMQACSCCSVRFRSGLCPQCYVAGCAHKGKGKQCLMNSGTKKTDQLSEFEVREAYSRLLAEHEQLLQSLPKPNGHAGPPPNVKVTTRLVEGELHG